MPNCESSHPRVTFDVEKCPVCEERKRTAEWIDTAMYALNSVRNLNKKPPISFSELMGADYSKTT